MSDDKSIPPAGSDPPFGFAAMPDGRLRLVPGQGEFIFKPAVVQPNGYPQPGPGGNTIGLVLPMTAPGPAGGKHLSAEELNQQLHDDLDLTSNIPGVSLVSGLGNAGLYALEGDKVNAALAAVSAVPGVKLGGTLAKVGGKVAKAFRGAEDAATTAKKAREAEQAAQAAREAAAKKAAAEKAAAEKAAADKAAAEAKGGAKKAEGEGGGYVAARKMKHKTVKCFKKNKKGKPNEYDRQLKDQEKGLNDMTVQEYLDGRERYQEIGRKGTGAAQAKARTKHQEKLTQKYKDDLINQGVMGEAAQQQAQAMAEKEMKTLAALHNPDMIAGGKDVITGMGDSGVNSSIGTQWKSRIGELDKAAREVPVSERATTRMSVTLSRC